MPIKNEESDYVQWFLWLQSVKEVLHRKYSNQSLCLMQKSEKDENKNCAKNNQKGSIGLRLNSCTYFCCISREHVELVDLEDLFMMAGLRDWWNTWSNWKICKFIGKYLTNCKNRIKDWTWNMISIPRSKKQDWLLSHEKYDGIFYEFLTQ